MSENNNQNNTVIQTSGMTRRFGARTAVDKLDLEVTRGEVFGFLGPNGAGKSTTIRILMGLLSPSEGTVNVLGYSMPKDADKLLPHVGYMTQKFSLYEDLSVRENLEFAGNIFGLDRRSLNQKIEDLSLREVAARLSRHLLSQARKHGGDVSDGVIFQLETTKSALAARLGTISETLSRTFKKLQQQGMVAVERDQVTLLDCRQLQQVADGDLKL